MDVFKYQGTIIAERREKKNRTSCSKLHKKVERQLGIKSRLILYNPILWKVKRLFSTTALRKVFNDSLKEHLRNKDVNIQLELQVL